MTHDPILEKIADYALQYKNPSVEALKCARLSLADSMGCAMLALQFPECTRFYEDTLRKSEGTSAKRAE